MNKTDSDQNVHFKTVYIVIRAGLVIIHHRDPRPIDLNQVPYVLIVVSPSVDGSVIRNIIGVYTYGTRSGDYIQFQISNINLLQLLPGTGSTILEKLQHHYLSLSGETQNTILHPSEPELNGSYLQQGTSDNGQFNTNMLPASVRLSYPGSTDFESFITSFMAGIGSHLAIFDILKHQQLTVGDPFYPVHIRQPLDNDQPENLLTQGVGEYLGYHARTLQSISRGEKSITRIGPTWLSMIDCFWKGHSICFKKGPLNDPSTAIHDTMIGYCRHQDNKIQILESRFREISVRADNYLNSIQRQGRTTLDQIGMTSETAQAGLLQVASGTTNLMAKTCQEFEERINVLSTKSVQTIQEERQSTISSITTLRSTAQKNIHKWADEGVEQIQLVYSQGFDEISKAKAESLSDIRIESQRSLDLISSEQDMARSNLEIVQRGVSKDLAELHNEGVEKNLLMIEDRKKDFFRFNSAIVDNIQNMANNNVSEITEIKDRIIKSNRLALDEIDIKVKNAGQKLQDMVTIGLTNMLDQQKHLTNGVRVDAKKVALEKLRQAMDQAVQETLQRLGVGIDQIIKASIKTQFESHLNKLNEEISKTMKTFIETKIVTPEISKDQPEPRIHIINGDCGQPRLDQEEHQLNPFVKLISFPQELVNKVS